MPEPQGTGAAVAAQSSIPAPSSVANPHNSVESQQRCGTKPPDEVAAEASQDSTANGGAEGNAVSTSGLASEQVAEIKAAIQAQQKFLGELVEHGTRWELEGSELRIYFSPDKRAFAEMLEGREAIEKVRASSSKVLGRAVRVCAKLETVAAAAASVGRVGSAMHELRAQFQRDPMVKSMLQRFGGRIAEVKQRPEEP